MSLFATYNYSMANYCYMYKQEFKSLRSWTLTQDVENYHLPKSWTHHTVKALLFVGYQFLWFSWIDQTTNFDSQMKRRTPLMCILKTLNPWIQESTNLCFFPDPRKLVSTNYPFTVFRFNFLGPFAFLYVQDLSLLVLKVNFNPWQILLISWNCQTSNSFFNRNVKTGEVVMITSNLWIKNSHGMVACWSCTTFNMKGLTF